MWFVCVCVTVCIKLCVGPIVLYSRVDFVILAAAHLTLSCFSLKNSNCYHSNNDTVETMSLVSNLWIFSACVVKNVSCGTVQKSGCVCQSPDIFPLTLMGLYAAVGRGFCVWSPPGNGGNAADFEQAELLPVKLEDYHISNGIWGTVVCHFKFTYTFTSTLTFRAFSRCFCPEWPTISTFVTREKPRHHHQ